MERRYPHLCSPITLGGITFRNRMFSAPTSGTDITADRCIGPKTTAYYELKAKGGAAAVTMSPVKVHPETDGSAQSFRLDLAVTGSLASFTYTADAIKRHGAVPSMLLSHGGQFAGAYMTDKKKLAEMKQYGPVDCVRYDGVPVKGLTHGQIADIVKATNIPTDLNEFGVKMEDLDFLVDAGSKQTRLLVNNMKELSLDDIRNIYLKVLK